MVRGTVCLFPLLALTGCPQYGVMDDGTSLSHGSSNDGRLLGAAKLPTSGSGYWIPALWKRRGLNYGTDELIAVIEYAGKKLAAQYPGARFGVADLSRRHGGRSAWHRSHQSGRDADLLFLATDKRGKPVINSSMRDFYANGTTRPARVAPAWRQTPSVLRFDIERNWYLVKTLIENPIAPIQYIFVADWLKQLMLDHAEARGEPHGLIVAAGYILHQPGDSAPHDDHYHVRILCATSDRDAGCSDRGWLRWAKKDSKYRGRISRIHVAELEAVRTHRTETAEQPKHNEL